MNNSYFQMSWLSPAIELARMLDLIRNSQLDAIRLMPEKKESEDDD